MSNNNTIHVQCPGCKQLFNVVEPVPETRSMIQPSDKIWVYRINSDFIKEFIKTKAKYYKPETKVELAPIYCEKKKRKSYDPRRSWASIRIAFSDDVLDKEGDEDWYERIGSDTDVRFIKTIFVGLIQKYRYDRKSLDDILGNYDYLEELEETKGITDRFIEDIRTYCTPKRVPTSAKESWIFFSARPEKIIEDILEDPSNNMVSGTVTIQQVYPVNKDSVEFVVHVSENGNKKSENPLVRKMLTNGKMSKD